MALIEVIVTDIVQETPTVKSFELTRPDGTPLGKYLPGAHIDVVGPTAITRQYSLCSRPDAEDGFVVAVKREENSRGGSAALHELNIGDTLKISEPRNLLQIQAAGVHHILIAAGIGITPMLSMARYMDVHGISFELHYFARTEEDAAFLPLLRDRCPEKLHANVGVNREDQEALLDSALRGAAEDTQVYVCGPDGFMTKVVAIATRYVPAESVHYENFHASEQPDVSENTAFDVELDGETYHVPPNRTIVSGGDLRDLHHAGTQGCARASRQRADLRRAGVRRGDGGLRLTDQGFTVGARLLLSSYWSRGTSTP